MTFEQNVGKFEVEIRNFNVRHRSGKIDVFNKLEALIVHFDELGGLIWSFVLIFKNSFENKDTSRP